MKKIIFALALVVAIGVVGASQLLASSSKALASTITIDDRDHGGAQCTVTNNRYQHADALVNAMADITAGGTIKVCPGKYDPVVVDKSVTIVGNSVTSTSATQCINPSSYPATDASKYAVVDGQGTQKAIDVSGITGPVVIQALTIQNGTSGVFMSSSTKKVAVTTNVIQNNSIGVTLDGGGSDPDKNKLQKNCIRRNTLDGGANGSGVYSDGSPSWAKIEKNTFFKNNHSGDGGAINLAHGGTDVLILANTSSQDANFVSSTNSTRLTIDSNTATGTLGGAVWLTGNNVDAQVTKNTFTNGHDDGIGLGGDNGPNDHVLIFGNTLTGNASDGIDTSDDNALTNSEIGNNKVQSNEDHGIWLKLTGNTVNFITGNTVSGNGVAQSDQCFDTDKVGNRNTWYGNGTDCKP